METGATRREHVSELIQTFGFRYFDEEARRELSAWLTGVAAQTDSSLALVEALLEEMRHRKIMAPAISATEGLSWEARRYAREKVARSLTADLTGEQLERLDTLLETAPDATRSELVWLRQPPGEPAPTAPIAHTRSSRRPQYSTPRLLS